MEFFKLNRIYPHIAATLTEQKIGEEWLDKIKEHPTPYDQYLAENVIHLQKELELKRIRWNTRNESSINISK